MNSKVLSGIAMLLMWLCACSPKPDNGEDRYIPEFHFTNGSGWTGEPSGMVYDNGEYHLFYQCNPSDALYGNIHWGHAVSRDLLQWRILPVALSPDSSGYLNSGSVVVDKNNTSGLGPAGNAPFIAFYTYQNPERAHTVSLAYSVDRGTTWTKYGTIALSDDKELAFRNPHVMWDELSGRWIMTVSVASSVRFYASADCKEWSFESEFEYPPAKGGNWEGTDFFPLTVGESGQSKWVLLVNMQNGPAGGASATRYFVGDFDGTAFRISQNKELWLDYGKDNYGGSSFQGMPSGERIWMGWMNCWEYANLLPTTRWRGSMTFPRKLQLVEEGTHLVLASAPVHQLDTCVKDTYDITPGKLSDEKKIQGSLPYPGEPFIIRLNFDTKDNRAIWRARDYGIRLITRSGRKLSIGYRNELSYYYIDRKGLSGEPFAEGFDCMTGAAYRSEMPVSDWCILLDRNSVELFADGGRIAISGLCFPGDAFTTFELFAESGLVTLLKGSIGTFPASL